MKHLFLVRFTARPEPDTEAFRESGGAYVVAWIDARSQSEALARAQREVRNAGWLVEATDEVVLVSRSDYAPDDPSLQHFEQALADGEALVFHTWPPEPQEDDLVH